MLQTTLDLFAKIYSSVFRDCESECILKMKDMRGSRMRVAQTIIIFMDIPGKLIVFAADIFVLQLLTN